MCYDLELKAYGKLSDPSGRGQTRDPREVRAVDAVELAINPELSVIQDVEELTPKLDFHPLVDPNVLDN